MGPINLYDYETLARQRLPPMVYDYYAGGAERRLAVAAVADLNGRRRPMSLPRAKNGMATQLRISRSILLAALVALALVTGSHAPLTPIPAAAQIEDPISESIQQGAITVSLQPVATGLTSPNWGTYAPGDSDRLFVVDQIGSVWAIDLATGDKTVFLDASDRLVDLGIAGPGSFDERGLLGLAFHPDYTSNGLLYTYTSEPVNGQADFSTMPPATIADHQGLILERGVPNPTDPASIVDSTSPRELLRIDQPQFNHDAGALSFGPDGMLYVSLGDGGSEDDQGDGHGTTGNGQDPGNVLGAILRIDPDGSNSANGQYGVPGDNPFVGDPGFADEIFAYGFRNPYRFSFDSATGDLYLGDVGQNNIEEVNVVVAGGNYGWNLKEGTFFFDPDGNNPGFVTPVDPGVPAGLMDPIAQYDHDEGIAVIGGFVYRGSAIPALQDRYVFGDFSRNFFNDGRLFYLKAGNQISEFSLDGQNALGLSLLGFGEDAGGELYVLANGTGTPFGDTGVVLRIVPPTTSPATGEHIRTYKVVAGPVQDIQAMRYVNSSGNVFIGGRNGGGNLAVKNVFTGADPILFDVGGVQGFNWSNAVGDSVIVADFFGPGSIAFIADGRNAPTEVSTVVNPLFLNPQLVHERSAIVQNQNGASKAYIPSFLEHRVYILDLDVPAVTGIIPVGTNPSDAQISESTGRAYVANTTDDTVSVIDTATDTVIAVIAVGDGPIQIAVHPTAGLVYVTNVSDDTVSVIDEATGTVVATIPVGDGPFGVGINHITGFVYVANQFDDTVSVIDGETNTVVATVDVGDFPTALAVVSSAGLIGVANFNDGTISVLAHTPTETVWTDVNCDGMADAIDALLVLRHVVSLPVVQGEACPAIGTNIAVAEGDDVTVRLFGDADCDGDVDAIDSLKKLRDVAGLSVSQTEPCPDIGSPVQIP